MKKMIVFVMVLFFVGSMAVAASYEKQVAKYLKTNADLPSEIVEGLMTCSLVKGMTEEEGRMVALKRTAPDKLLGALAALSGPAEDAPETQVSRMKTIDEDGKEIIELSFFDEQRGQTKLYKNYAGKLETRGTAAKTIMKMVLYFVDNKLVRWEAMGSFGDDLNDKTVAKIRAGIEKELAKPLKKKK